jgi:hypothetical protein
MRRPWQRHEWIFWALRITPVSVVRAPVLSRDLLNEVRAWFREGPFAGQTGSDRFGMIQQGGGEKWAGCSGTQVCEKHS